MQINLIFLHNRNLMKYFISTLLKNIRDMLPNPTHNLGSKNSTLKYELISMK